MSQFRQQNLGGSRTALLDYEFLEDKAQSPNAVLHDSIERTEVAPLVPGAIVVEYLFSRAAAVLAAVYVCAFLFFSNYLAPGADVPLWTLRSSPQTGVALCLIIAAAFLRLWRGATGKALALTTYLFIAWQFYCWFKLTAKIKANTGSEAVSSGDWIGNTLYGAGWLDAGTLLAVLAFIFLSAYLLKHDIADFVERRRAGKKPQEESAPRPLIDHRVNGYGVRNN